MACTDSKEHSAGGLTSITRAALDRISVLAQNDTRLRGYLNMKTTAERQRALKEARLAAGMKLSNVWLPQEVHESLRERFPGQRGGIDWERVARAALMQGNV